MSVQNLDLIYKVKVVKTDWQKQKFPLVIFLGFLSPNLSVFMKCLASGELQALLRCSLNNDV